MQRVIDLLDAAAKRYPLKALCDEIGKAESTLRNELTEQPGCKLGLRTSLQILKTTRDLSALDAVEEMFGRVAFRLPRCTDSFAPVMKLAGDVTREFGEHMQVLAGAMDDGVITREEAGRVLRELKDVIAACLQLQGYLERRAKGEP